VVAHLKCVLSFVGGTLGLLLGYAGVRTLLVINPGNIPRIGEQGSTVPLDWRVLVFTLLAAALTEILFGLLPASATLREDFGAALKRSGARSGSGVGPIEARQNATSPSVRPDCPRSVSILQFDIIYTTHLFTNLFIYTA